MSKLEKLYSTIQNLRELKIEVPESLLEETERVENEFILNDIVPEITRAIQPFLNVIQKELTFVISHRPGFQLDVTVKDIKSELQSYEGGDMSDTVEEEDENPGVNEDEELGTSGKLSISKPHRLKVIFPDGTVISEGFAAYTFFKTIDRIGPKLIEPLGIRISGVPLVSENSDLKYQQRRVRDGYNVCTHSNTKTKKNILDAISRKLDLNLRVFII